MRQYGKSRERRVQIENEIPAGGLVTSAERNPDEYRVCELQADTSGRQVLYELSGSTSHLHYDYHSGAAGRAAAIPQAAGGKIARAGQLGLQYNILYTH